MVILSSLNRQLAFLLRRDCKVGEDIPGNVRHQTTVEVKYYCGKNSSFLPKVVDMKDGTTRIVASPGSSPNGIGGDVNVIWHSDGRLDEATPSGLNRLYELSVADFSVVRYTSAAGISGCGGKSDVVYTCDAAYVRKRSVTDFSVLQTKDLSGYGPPALGTNYVWDVGGESDYVYALISWWGPAGLNLQILELDENLDVLGVVVNATSNDRGCGGSRNLLVIATYGTVILSPFSAGGDEARIL